jgi:hypothetical protein
MVVFGMHTKVVNINLKLANKINTIQRNLIMRLFILSLGLYKSPLKLINPE